jgi:glycosyltransferase involved in cell wall biosynthesis
MHVLMISVDSSLASGQDAAVQRHLAFAERVESLTIVVRTHGSTAQARQLSPKLRVLPTNSRHPLLFVQDAVCIARALPCPDLIVTQDMFTSGLAGWWLRGHWRVPLLVQNHTYLFGNPHWLAEYPLRNRLLLALAGFVRGRADFLRTVNRIEREQYIASGGDARRVAALPLATASVAFAQPVPEARLKALRAELSLPDEAEVVLWVGYPSPVKRVPLLLRVFACVAAERPLARLLLVGDLSRSREDLPALVRQMNIEKQVMFHPAVPHDELPAYYVLARVYVHTSSYEGVPRVLLEASAAGLPLVGMQAVGVEEVIEDGVNGYLIAQDDEREMARRIVGLLDDPQHAQRLGEAARTIALERYNADDYADNWVAIWREAVNIGLKSGRLPT